MKNYLKNYMNKNVIVTGGAGFIGSHLVDLLINKDFKVTVFDNLSTGRKENVNKKANFIKIDVTDFDKISPLVLKIKPSCIFHLAAWPRIERSMDDPIGTNNVNVNGTLSMLEAARISKVPRFVYSSSSSVYGRQNMYKMNENLEPHPMSHYALQKLIGEKYCSFYAEKFKMNIVSLRYFSVYGDRQPGTGAYALVIAKFLDQLKLRKNLTVFGDGTQTRDFTHVSDVALANLSAMTTKLPTGRNLILNIGTSRETSVNQIVGYLKANADYVIPNPRGDYEEKRKCADIKLAERYLDWRPKINLEDEIKLLKQK